MRNRLRQISAVFHGCFMPSSRPNRERLRGALAVAAVGLCAAGFGAAADAAELPRFASINLCTDQLLMALADPRQILGLSPYARDPARSWDVAKASQFPRLSGEAEDVLLLQPDIVVAGRYTKRATRELLKEKGLRVVEFDAARSLDDVKAQLRRMGDLTGHPDRAAAEIGRLDAAMARARGVASQNAFRVLAVSRRGWVSGADNLTTSLLSAVGLSNAGGELGLKAGGYASLEAIVALRPDFILVSDGGDFAEDEGRAFLLHPALERFYPATRRIVIPERLTVCGGPMLSEALDLLAAELERVASEPEPAAPESERVNH
jgi:iron complex transport system substrate-binding protein